MHMLSDPSGLRTKSTGAPHAELDCSIHCFSSASLTCCSIPAFSFWERQKGGLLKGVDPGMIGIQSGVRSPSVEAPVSCKLGERNTSSYCLRSVSKRPDALVAGSLAESTLRVSTTNGEALPNRGCCNNLAARAADRTGELAAGAFAPTCVPGRRRH